MVEECLARLPEQLREVSALPGGTLPDEMPETLLILWKKRAEEAAAMQLPAIYATDWLRYSRTGNRAEYESRYFPRRRRLTDLVCGALAGEPGLEDAILDTIWAICEETAWQLPAHNTYIRDTPSLEWPDPERPIVDLFAAAINGTALPSITVKPDAYLGITLAADGYPQSPVHGQPLPAFPQEADVTLDYANVAGQPGALTGAGGRLVTVIGHGPDVVTAQKRAYAYLNKLTCPQCFYRKDIGFRATGKTME